MIILLSLDAVKKKSAKKNAQTPCALARWHSWHPIVDPAKIVAIPAREQGATKMSVPSAFFLQAASDPARFMIKLISGLDAD